MKLYNMPASQMKCLYIDIYNDDTALLPHSLYTKCITNKGSLHQQSRVAFKTKCGIPLPRTTTSFIYRLMASVAMSMKVTRKKYCSRAAMTTHILVSVLLWIAKINVR